MKEGRKLQKYTNGYKIGNANHNRLGSHFLGKMYINSAKYMCNASLSEEAFPVIKQINLSFNPVKNKQLVLKSETFYAEHLYTKKWIQFSK